MFGDSKRRMWRERRDGENPLAPGLTVPRLKPFATGGTVVMSGSLGVVRRGASRSRSQIGACLRWCGPVHGDHGRRRSRRGGWSETIQPDEVEADGSRPTRCRRRSGDRRATVPMWTICGSSVPHDRVTVVRSDLLVVRQNPVRLLTLVGRDQNRVVHRVHVEQRTESEKHVSTESRCVDRTR